MNKQIWAYFLSILFIIASLSWLAILSRPDERLSIIACDVGQGDAILITKGTTQVLVDGGPGKAVISCLSRHMPFWDRNIEMVVLTHPDADHASGLVEVFRSYHVSHFVSSGQGRDTLVYKTLVELIAESGAKQVQVKSNDRLRYQELYFDILHPDDKVLGITSDKVNNSSVVMKLSYGEFDALLTGDIENEISDLIADKYDLSAIEYLKVPHHGSKNGLSRKLLDEVHPQYAVISAGKNNRFGHPHSEVLKILSNSQSKLLRTDLLGDVVVKYP